MKEPEKCGLPECEDVNGNSRCAQCPKYWRTLREEHGVSTTLYKGWAEEDQRLKEAFKDA